MSPQAKSLVQQLGALSPDELDAVWAATLSDSALAPNWVQTLRRRRAALASGQMPTLTRAQADAELKARISASHKGAL